MGERDLRFDSVQVDHDGPLVLGIRIGSILFVVSRRDRGSPGARPFVDCKNTIFAPASMAMLATVKRSSIDSVARPGPTNSIERYKAPSTPILPMMERIRSLPVAQPPSFPFKTKRMAPGTLNHAIPAAMARPYQ